MIIKHFPKIKTIGDRLLTHLFDDEVEISEKADGCFEYNAKIVLADGSKKKIGRIVNQKLDLEVLSFDEKTNNIEIKKIVGWHKSGKSDEWLKIKIESYHGQKYHLNCTPEHRIFIEDVGWIKAKDLKIGDCVMHREMFPSPIIQQILLGCMLGDGGAINHRFYYAHSLKQEILVDFIIKILGSDISKKEYYVTGYGSDAVRIRTKQSPVFYKIEELCKKDNKKRVNENWLKKLTPISLAFWYMDDGSLSHNDFQRDRALFHTEGFCLEEQELLQKILYDKFNLKSSILRYRKYYYLALDTNSSEQLFGLIHPYILEDLQYKLPKLYQSEYCYWNYYYDYNKPKLVSRCITDIKKYIPSNPTKYDLEIEDNHNYFVNNILVHNSQFRIYLNTDGLFEVGSKNQEGLELFKSRIEMTKSNNKHDMFDLAVEKAEELKPSLSVWLGTNFGMMDITLYIEYLRNLKHNALRYERLPKNNFYLFGVTATLNNGNILNYNTTELIELANYLHIEPLNILYEGKISNQYDLKEMLERESILGGTKVEGIVIKNYSKTYPADLLSTERYVGFPLAGKLVRDEFKEVQRDEWHKQKKANSIDEIAETYLTKQRFLKSIQHLQEENRLTWEKKDLAILIPAVLNDLLEEEGERINKIVLDKFHEEFRRRISNYVVKQYTEYLLAKQFK